MAVYFENHVIHLSAFCGKMQSFDMPKLVFRIVATML